jgi:Rrf2 family transcriptional regulator, nitric oxide-sensitive transcriptional repressor
MNPGQVEDYAVRALVDLMLHPDAPIREIAARTAIPAAHLAKVIQALARAGLVETTRGRGGGVRLAYPPGEISLRHAVEAVQGPLRFWRCPRRGSGCPRDPNCPIYRFWIDLEAAIAARLERLRLTDLRYDCPSGLPPSQD